MFLTRTALVLALVFAGALFWARQRDPFKRIWFEVHPSTGAPSCVAVLPKTQPGPLAVVIYLHGSGGNVLRSGNDLRSISEMGIAAVGMDYCQTNDARFEAEFTALLDHVRRQPWADTNRIGWLGYSLGAQQQLRYLLQHPARAPTVLARLGGGMIDELQPPETPPSEALPNREKAREPAPPDDKQAPAILSPSKILLLHGELDEIFPVADVEKLAALLRARGAGVDTVIIPALGHGLGEDRARVFRWLGEYFLIRLGGAEALRSYQSIHAWRESTTSLWPCLLPAVVVSAWFARRKVPRLFRRAPGPRSAGSILLWTAAILLACAAGLQLSLHVLLPRLQATPRNLALARRVLVQARDRADFDFLARDPAARTTTVGTLAQHAHLANYNRQIVNWQVEDALYREYVLSPQIRAGEQPGNWRRTLWESCYPRVRNCPDMQSAAAAVARHLHERVTVATGADWPSTVTDIWRKQITDADGFNAIHVAALRACGIPARLDSDGHPELWAGDKWERAPEALMKGNEGKGILREERA